jgi:N-acetyltransferase
MGWPGDYDRWFDEALASPVEVPFAVVLRGEPVGSTRYLNYLPEHRRVEIGWTWCRRSAWKTGANAETKYLLLRHAFEVCGLQRVEFKTDARNQQTRGALLAAGARFEGIARKHMILPNGPRDSAWYAVTEDDWPEVRERQQRRIEGLAAG